MDEFVWTTADILCNEHCERLSEWFAHQITQHSMVGSTTVLNMYINGPLYLLCIIHHLKKAADPSTPPQLLLGLPQHTWAYLANQLEAALIHRLGSSISISDALVRIFSIQS